jgi:tetratricopeptide (TPR) repeat protein
LRRGKVAAAQTAEPAERDLAPATAVRPAPVVPDRRRRHLLLGGSLAALLLLSPWAYRWLAETPRSASGKEQLSSDPAARDHYLAGTYQMALRTAPGLRRAVHLFTQAIAHDPDFAAAYAGLAKTYVLLAEYKVLPRAKVYPLSRAAARKALELDPRQSGAYAALGLVAFYGDRDFRASRTLLEQALGLDPGSAETLHWLALTTVLTGEFDLAVSSIARAQELDPDSRAILANKGQILYRAGELERAVQLLEPFVETTPEYAAPHFYLTDIYMEQGRLEDAIRHGLEAARLTDNGALHRAYEAAEAGFRRAGKVGLLQDMLAVQLELHRAGQVSAYMVARTLARLDRPEEAFACLQQAVAAKETDALKTDRTFVTLRGGPRFSELLVAIGHTADYPSPSLVSAETALSPVTAVPH